MNEIIDHHLHGWSVAFFILRGRGKGIIHNLLIVERYTFKEIVDISYGLCLNVLSILTKQTLDKIHIDVQWYSIHIYAPGAIVEWSFL